jgi:hypothetical protein
VLVLRHLARDRTIWGEVEAGRSQKRYAETMPETIEWLMHLERENLVRLDDPVDATTIISYRQPELIRTLLDEVYVQTLRLQQPECQVIWSALSQLYPFSVQRVDWNELDPLWRVSYTPLRERILHFVRRLLHLVRGL